MTEILAPVGGHEHMIAAVRSGADAIYLGTKNFNARRNAANFDGKELKDIVSYCHMRNVKVYITMNTLITDGEINDAISTIYDIANSGADAIIIQDIAVAYLVKEICPTMKMHASTQMTVTNIDGVNLLENMGFSRVVLARELSVKEIESIVRKSKIEIEVFVHGALCMSVSGTCYLSSAIGERCGNRGLCAQPCRLNFKYKEKPFALSLKDMSYINHIPDLEKIGVHSLKIEGRMKRPEYVAMAVDSCRKALLKKSYNFSLLKDVFSRDGFTDGYLTGKRNSEMFGIRSKKDVDASISVIKDISKVYCKDKELQKIKINGSFIAKKNIASSFTVTDGIYKVIINGSIPQMAKNNSLEGACIKNNLEKTGGTPFVFENLDIDVEPDLFLYISEINHIRRDAICKLESLRSKVVPHDINKFNYNILKYKSSACTIRLRFQKFEQSFSEEFIEYVILPMQEILLHPECISLYGEKLVCELPSLCFQDNLDTFYSQLNKIYRSGIRRVICENICMIETLKNFDFVVMGGHGFNIQNTISLNQYSMLDISDFTISFELYSKKISNLGGNVKRGIIGYGRLPLMKFRACPGYGQNCQKCDGNPILTDRMGKTFQVVCSEHKYSCMLNCVPLYIGDRFIDNVDFYTLYFTSESKDNAKQILSLFINKKPINTEKTTGMYFRKLR